MNTSHSRSLQQRHDNQANLLRRMMQVSICLALTVPTNAKLFAQYNGFFSNIRPVAGLETPAGQQFANYVSNDGLTLLFKSAPSGLLYEATRESIVDPFAEPVKIDSLNGLGTPNFGQTVSSDGRVTYFSSGPEGGTTSIWTAERESQDADWGEPQKLEFDDGATFTRLTLSSDDLTMYYNRNHAGRDALYKVERQSVSDPFGEPEAISELNSYGNVVSVPTVSSDELAIMFSTLSGGQLSTMIATRPSKSEPFSDPVDLDDFGLGSAINSQFGFSAFAVMSPNWPADGSKLYFTANPGNFRIHEATWSVATAPDFTSLKVGETYSQDFDILGADGADGTALPTAWTVTDEPGIPRQMETNLSFPTSRSAIEDSFDTTFAFSAGQSEDRSLATYNRLGGDATIQLLADTDAQADALKIDFSVEAWDRIRATPWNRDGEAKFDVTVDIAHGEGTSDLEKAVGGDFTELLNLGTVTTGAVLPVPDGDFLDGNDPAHRVSFASDVMHANIPAGSRLRFRWQASSEVQDASSEWIFGLDDVSITLASAGDANLDGQVNAADLNTLALNWRDTDAPSWSRGDFTGDGKVDALDLNALALNWRSGVAAAASAPAVPEPSSITMLLLGLCGVVRRAGRAAG